MQAQASHRFSRSTQTYLTRYAGFAAGVRDNERPSAWSVRRLPSPCERRTDPAEGPSGLTLGRYVALVNDCRRRRHDALSTLVDKPVDGLWNSPRALWTKPDGRCKSLWGHALRDSGTRR